MATIPACVENHPFITVDDSPQSIDEYFASLGMPLLYRGKVRNTYEWATGAWVSVATDRLSVFDHVLPVTVPHKGAVLTALTHFWLTRVLYDVPHHLIPSRVRGSYNAAFDLALERPVFPLERSLVIQPVEVLPYELIFRAHIGGSVWNEYQKSGTAAGESLPPGLKKWQMLDVPVFTPSTKAESGHDVNITVAEYRAATGSYGMECVGQILAAYQRVYEYAAQRGVLILDSKCEAGAGPPFMLIDEAFTPDSSRITLADDLAFALADGRDPIFYDKEPVRAWGREQMTPFDDQSGAPIIGINKLKPENPEHCEFIAELQVPKEIIVDTTRRYLEIFEILVGESLEDYQVQHMGVSQSR